MRGGYPVHVCHVTTSNLCQFWQVRSSFVTCPHRHRTQESAKKCLPAMIEKYKELRWPKKKA